MEQRTFALPEGLVSALLNYLGQKPHAEVHQLVGAISQTVQAQLSPEELAAIQGRQQAASAPAPEAKAS